MKRLVMIFVLACAAGGVASAEPPHTHEIIYTRPSGFWTSNRPATNGSYRYRLLGIGIAVAGLTGLVMLRLVKSANAYRHDHEDHDDDEDNKDDDKTDGDDAPPKP